MLGSKLPWFPISQGHIGIPYWRWDDHSPYSNFWPWHICMTPVDVIVSGDRHSSRCPGDPNQWWIGHQFGASAHGANSGWFYEQKSLREMNFGCWNGYLSRPMAMVWTQTRGVFKSNLPTIITNQIHPVDSYHFWNVTFWTYWGVLTQCCRCWVVPRRSTVLGSLGSISRGSCVGVQLNLRWFSDWISMIFLRVFS